MTKRTPLTVHQKHHPPDYEAILQAERNRRGGLWRVLQRGFWGLLAVAVLVASVQTAEVSVEEFWQGLPRMGEWLIRLWPPDFSEFPSFLAATWETLAIAIVGTGAAIMVAVPLAILVARNITPLPLLVTPLRFILNLLRGIDTAIFALFFVSIVGLGPFAGVLGVAFHTTGSMAKLYGEVLETIPPEPIEAIEATGTDRIRTFAFAVLPEAMAALERVQLLDVAFQRADRLSGGQQQRVAIARALTQRARLILADEPIASLDPETAHLVLGLLRSLCIQEGLTVVCNLHQVELAKHYSDRVLGIQAGELILDMPTSQLSSLDINRIYRS